MNHKKYLEKFSKVLNMNDAKPRSTPYELNINPACDEDSVEKADPKLYKSIVALFML